MRGLAGKLLMCIMLVLSGGCTYLDSLPDFSVPPTPAPVISCVPTHADDLSGAYRPNTPIRNVVGHGHRVGGIVRSSRDCSPIAGAHLEMFPEGPNGTHPGGLRATVITDSSGAYWFECPLSDHIHMRISAPGFRTIATNLYHMNGKAEGTFDIVLVPEGK